MYVSRTLRAALCNDQLPSSAPRNHHSALLILRLVALYGAVKQTYQNPTAYPMSTFLSDSLSLVRIRALQNDINSAYHHAIVVPQCE